MVETYALTIPNAVEANSVVTITKTIDVQVALGDLLAEYNVITQYLDDLETSYLAEVAAKTARKNELYGVLSQIKTTNNLTFQLS